MEQQSQFGDYERVRSQWESLLEGPERTYNRDAPDFVQERLAILALQAEPPKRIDAFEGNFQQFLGDDTALYPHPLSAGFVMNDNRLHKGLSQLLARPASPYLAPEVTGYRARALYTAHAAQEKYFGAAPLSLNPQALRKRYKLLFAHEQKALSPPRLSIAVLRKFAACAERAAAANNVLHIFGFAPIYEMGAAELGEWRSTRKRANSRPDTSQSNPHAFLVVTGDTAPLLYDPTNACPLLDKRGRFLETLPPTYQNNSLTKERGVEIDCTLNAIKWRPNRIGFIIRSQLSVRYRTHHEGRLLQPI